MVYTATTAAQNRTREGISLARASIDLPQRASVMINGFDYPGELLFADLWQPWFGAQLPERVMFRLVLLSAAQRIDRADITDRFTLVALPGPRDTGNGSDDFAQLNREIGRLNEIRERYVTSTDSGLQGLASSLVGKATDAQRTIAGVLADRWRHGQIVTSPDSEAITTADAIFIGDDPAVWIEAVAASMFARPGETRFIPDSTPPEALFTQIASFEGDDSWRTDLDGRLRAASGASLIQIVESIRSVADEDHGKITGGVLQALLLRLYRLSPGLASILVAAFIRIENGELELLTSKPADLNRIDQHSLSVTSYDPDLVHAIEWLSDEEIGDWNSALPYVRALLPHAAPTNRGVPDPQFETQLKQVVETFESRNALTLSTLSLVSGPAVDSLPSVMLMRRLMPVLGAAGWRSFYRSATDSFPDVTEFINAVTESSVLRALCEDVVDVQAAHEFVVSADFGRGDQLLATDSELLNSRLDVPSILVNHAPIAPVLHDFQQWKRRYTAVYRAHHAERRSRDLDLTRRIGQADLQHTAVRKLSLIPELHGILAPEFPDQWEELKKRVQPCTNREDELALQNQPYCVDCGVRMGSLGHEDEVEERIAEIQQMLQACNTRLSEIAVSRVISGQREDELRQLIRMNAIADLTAISHLLDDGVMSFLKRFASDSPTAQG